MFKKNVVFLAAILMGSILLGSIGILTVNSRVYGQTQNKTEAPEMIVATIIYGKNIAEWNNNFVMTIN
jgi:hypothetical protein